MRELSVKRAHLVVIGRVQGVGFRAFAQQEASKRNLVGWVRNVPDGNVEMEVEGPLEIIEGFLLSLKTGPAFSTVETVKTEWKEVLGKETGFHIRR